jgi:methionyl-tRNA synthetase
MDEGVAIALDAIETKIHESMKAFRMREANEGFMEIARLGNKYLQEQAPWKMVKEAGTEEAVSQCMYTSIHLVERLAKWSEIFLPSTADKLRNLLNINDSTNIAAGHQLATPELIFTKIEDDQIEAQRNKLKTPEKKETPSVEDKPIKDMIQFEDFTKLDIRVGTISAAEKMEKADKLLVLEVDLGSEKRTIVSGIAEHYAPADILGKQVSVLVNLAPRKLRGVESQGMILMAENESGQLSFVSPLDQIENGSEIR